MSNEQFEPVSREQLVALPKWALVAFAARCARRVQPLFDLPEEHPDRWRYLVAVDEAVTLSERYVDVVRRGLEFDEGLRARCVDARDGALAASELVVSDLAVLLSASEAASAAWAAGYAVDLDTIEGAYSAADSSVEACALVGGMRSCAVGAAAAHSDLQRLKGILNWERHRGRQFTMSSAFGPLWPEGPPDWYPDAKERMDQLLVQARDELVVQAMVAGPSPAPGSPVNAAPGTAASPLSLYFDLEEFTPEQIEEQIAALANLYHAISDDDLRIVGRTFLSPTLVPVEG